MVSQNLEKIFFHYLLEHSDLLTLVTSKFFENEFIKKIFELSKDFSLKYNEKPSYKQIYELINLKDTITKEDDEKLSTLFVSNVKEYDDEWINENIKGWIEFKNLDLSVIDLLTYLKTTNITMDNVSDVVEKAKSIISDRNNIDFDFDEGLDFFNPDSHEQPLWDTFSTGFPYLDLVLGGGWMTKSLYVVAGENKIGKCSSKNTEIKVRNKKTGDIEEISYEDFFKKVKK